MPKEATSEAHLSAERPQAGEAPRIPSPHVDASWPSGDPQPPPEGPRSAVSVTPMRGRANFLDLRRNGVRARSGPFVVTFAPWVDDGPVQVGYAVSRRVGNAVVRNRLRRRLRAILDGLARAGNPTLRGGRYVISPNPAAVHLSFPQLEAAVQGALEKATQRAVSGLRS